MLNQPRPDLIRSPFVMDFGDDERSLRRKKPFTAAQNLVLAAFHINLD